MDVVDCDLLKETFTQIMMKLVFLLYMCVRQLQYIWNCNLPFVNTIPFVQSVYCLIGCSVFDKKIFIFFMFLGKGYNIFIKSTERANSSQNNIHS